LIFAFLDQIQKTNQYSRSFSLVFFHWRHFQSRRT